MITKTCFIAWISSLYNYVYNSRIKREKTQVASLGVVQQFERPYWTEKTEIHAKRQHHARSLVITPNPGGYFRILKDNSWSCYIIQYFSVNSNITSHLYPSFRITGWSLVICPDPEGRIPMYLWGSWRIQHIIYSLIKCPNGFIQTTYLRWNLLLNSVSYFASKVKLNISVPKTLLPSASVVDTAYKCLLFLQYNLLSHVQKKRDQDGERDNTCSERDLSVSLTSVIMDNELWRASNFSMIFDRILIAISILTPSKTNSGDPMAWELTFYHTCRGLVSRCEKREICVAKEIQDLSN